MRSPIQSLTTSCTTQYRCATRPRLQPDAWCGSASESLLCLLAPLQTICVDSINYCIWYRTLVLKRVDRVLFHYVAGGARNDNGGQVLHKAQRAGCHVQAGQQCEDHQLCPHGRRGGPGRLPPAELHRLPQCTPAGQLPRPPKSGFS